MNQPIRPPPPQRALVFGAGGGIGGALVSRLAERQFDVVALARRAAVGDTAVRRLVVDIEDEASIAGAAQALAGGPPITRIFVATGLLHAEDLNPERSNGELDAAHLMRLFAVNAVGPALVAKHFLPLLPKSGRAVFAVLSARVGSIGDNRLGGWHSYRASKAALNMLIRTLSIELRRTRPDAILVGLHPGTVDTGLSKPFQARIPKLFTPIQAADHLLAVADTLEPHDSGGVFAWDRQRIPE
ncbi:MAG: SDR family NAD(P)-dependent oxidoreductase [Caulobacteraceae bacterium]